MNDDDRELLMLLGSVGIRVGEIVTGLFEDSLSCDEQIAFGQQLVELAEGFRQRVLRAPIVIDDQAVLPAGWTDLAEVRLLGRWWLRARSA